MTNTREGRTEGRRKRWWTALAGMLVFVALGLALAPGLTRRGKDAVPEPSPLEPRPARTARLEPPQAGPSGVASAGPESAPAPAPNPEGPVFDCMIEPNEVVEIGSPIIGLIDEIAVERSDYVEAGQVVARLESSVEQAAVRVARARARRNVELESSKVSLQLGEKRRARARELFEGNSLSLDLREEVETEATLAALELEKARENHRLANLELAQATAGLERRTIRSPISGFVVERLMAPGEVVDQETILRIAQIDPLRVEVILPPHLFGHVRLGDRARIVPEPPLDQPRSAEVGIVDRTIDGASGTFGARLLLPNPEHDLPAGLRCRVSFAGKSS